MAELEEVASQVEAPVVYDGKLTSLLPKVEGMKVESLPAFEEMTWDLDSAKSILLPIKGVGTSARNLGVLLVASEHAPVDPTALVAEARWTLRR